MVTFDTDAAQGELLIDQVKTVIPGDIFVRPEFLNTGFAMVPEPEIFTHSPVPVVGALPAKKVEAVPVVAHNV